MCRKLQCTVQKTAVQETALIPLAIRANETERKTERIHDNKAVAIIRELDVDTEKLDRFLSHEGVIARTVMFDETVKSCSGNIPMRSASISAAGSMTALPVWITEKSGGFMLIWRIPLK